MGNRINRDILYGKTIDIHTHSMGIDLLHLRNGKYPITQDVLDLSNVIKNNNIDYAVTFPMPTTVYYNADFIAEEEKFVASGYSKFPYQYENLSLCKIIDNLEIKNIIPFAAISIHDKIDEQLEFICDLNERFGIYGLKYHSTVERVSVTDSRINPFVELAKKLNIPMMFHSALSEASHPKNIISLAEKFPSVRMCIAHCARFDKSIIEYISHSTCDNIFVDTAPFIRLCNITGAINNDNNIKLDYNSPVDVLERLMNLIPNNLLWGTDVPWHVFENNGEMNTYFDEINVLKKCEVKARIMMDNAVNYLFGYAKVNDD